MPRTKTRRRSKSRTKSSRKRSSKIGVRRIKESSMSPDVTDKFVGSDMLDGGKTKGSRVQAVLFKASKYQTQQARKWLDKYGLKPTKSVHKTKNYLRYRMAEPIKKNKFFIKSAPKHEVEGDIKFVFQTSKNRARSKSRSGNRVRSKSHK